MAKPAPSPITHEWVGFEDAEGTTWMFDLTFLLSSWTCIFGNGCKGVLDADATDMAQGCCSYGAHVADKSDRKPVAAAAKQLTPDVRQLTEETKAEGAPTSENDDCECVSLQASDAACYPN